MILKTTSSFFANDAMLLAGFAARDSLWRNDAAKALEAYARDLYPDDAIAAVQNARRVIRVFVAGLENDADLKDRLSKARLSNWGEFTEPPVPRSLQDSLVEKLYIVTSKDDVPMLELGDQARYIGVKLFERCIEQNLTFDIGVNDENFMTLVLNAATDAGIDALAAYTVKARKALTTRILVQHNLPVWPVIDGDEKKERAYRAGLAPWRERVLGGKIRSVLTSIPTTKDAAVDGIEYKDYVELYFRMCDQPWDLIKQAQALLIGKLNAGKVLRFTNSDGTDLRMNIDGFTFCNSVIARNIPGSEVFSAPKIDSTNGTIVANGRFASKEDPGAVMEDITLTFKDGLLTSAAARVGQPYLDKSISIDAGARRIGEIGIGTNPYLKRHVASILLSEKIGGSFHVALGDAYTMTEYMGDAVVVDNGNRSHLHWDITTMLIGKAGRINLDGIDIMADGLFTDPALDVLNRGWQAVPFDQRPAEWQKIYPNQSEG